MAILNQWQRIDRVIGGKPFGNGSDGDLSSSTIPTMINETCSGTSGSTSLTVGGTTISDNDIVLIIQIGNPDTKTWEINKVISGGGTTSLTLDKELQNTYVTDTSWDISQITVIKQYENVTASGTWTLPDYDGTVESTRTGGILTFAADKITIINGNLIGTGKGYRGGDSGGCSRTTTDCDGFGTYSAEGINGDSRCHSSFNTITGGGGGWSEGPKSQAKNAQGGGGGGNGTSGTSISETGTDSNASCPAQPAAQPGTTWGEADLTTIHFGGGGGTGGGRQGNVNNRGGKGGDGGGMMFIFAKDLVITGTITNNGENGGTFDLDGGGGGGAGGSSLFVVETATLGTNLITATGGTGGARGNYGGRGGVGGDGRIAVHHSKAITGTTNPIFTDVDDRTLVEQSGSLMGLVI